MTKTNTITMPKGKPTKGTVYFVYCAKHWQGSIIETSGELTEEQDWAIVAIIQGMPVAYEGESK